MQLGEVVFLGIKKQVLAIEKRTGRTLWATQLSGGGIGGDFVTLLVDGPLLFAYTGGHLHGLDAVSGKVLRKNELPGCGYGFASLAKEGGSAPDPAVVSAFQAALAASQAAAQPAHSPPPPPPFAI